MMLKVIVNIMDKKQQKEIRNMKKVYIVAELSANHNNDFQLAKDTITAMKEAGADAVKFQTYTADSLTLDVDNKYFKPRTEGLLEGATSLRIIQRSGYAI